MNVFDQKIDNLLPAMPSTKMNITSLQEIKKDLQELPQKELAELCIQLAKYKKDNKEYLGYLLYEAQNKEGFFAQVKTVIDDHFREMEAQKNLYYIKKSLRKLLRILNKYCRYMNDKATTVEVLIYFCRKLKESGIPIHESVRLEKLFLGQLKKIRSFTASLHEDLQADHLKELEAIEGTN